jgi:hypothetical protein
MAGSYDYNESNKAGSLRHFLEVSCKLEIGSAGSLWLKDAKIDILEVKVKG